jgi:RimJ/RimL family protein N-acetyltransferase
MLQQTTPHTLPAKYAPLTELPPRLIPGDALNLRAGTAEDVAEYHRLDSDPKLSKYLTLSRTTPLGEYPVLLSWITTSFAGSCNTQPLFSWLIEVPGKPNHCAGYVEASVGGEKTLVIGCSIDPNHQRKRLASAACRTLLGWATSLPVIDEIQGLCHPQNQQAQNLFRSLGMQNTNYGLTSERFTFPNFYPANSYAVERSQMQVWRLLKNQHGPWPASALPSALSLDTSMSNPLEK